MNEPASQTLHLRMLEAMLFASERPLEAAVLKERLPATANLDQLLADLAEHYQGRGVVLKKIADGWTFRTADDLAFLLQSETAEQRRLSRAALETLSIVAYHQPATRAEIEQIRGVSTSRGTFGRIVGNGLDTFARPAQVARATCNLWNNSGVSGAFQSGIDSRSAWIG